MDELTTEDPQSGGQRGGAKPVQVDLHRQYWAFISYRHLDNQQPGRQWATWLHQQLETYDIPRDLVGQTNERGDLIPEHLFPVFRDQEELAADANLPGVIRSALDRSKFLIVLCSPNAVESTHVANEVLYFKQLGRSDRILAILIEGEPNVSWDVAKQKAGLFSPFQECFPLPLIHPLNANGELDLTKRCEPVAADFRLPGAQKGWTNPEAYREELETQGFHKSSAVRKLIDEYDAQLQLGLRKALAGTLGIPLNKLTQRGEAWELEKARRKARALTAWLTLSAILSIGAVAGGGFGWTQLIEARKQTEEARNNLKLAKDNEARAKANEERARASETESAGMVSFMTFQLVQGLRDYVPGTVRQPILERLQDYYERVGRVSTTDQDRLFSVIHTEAGDKALREGKAESAREHYQKALEIARNLQSSEPENIEHQRDLGVAIEKLGNLEFTVGRTQEAKTLYEQVLVEREDLMNKDPDNPHYRRDLAVIHDMLGNVELRIGKSSAAKRFYLKAKNERQRLIEDHPTNRQYHADHAVSLSRLGDLAIARLGDAPAALDYHSDALKQREQLVSLDRTNTQFRRDMCVSYERLGDVLLWNGDTRGARDKYEAARYEREKLVDLDPANTIFRCDLSVSYERLSDMFFQLERHQDAVQWLEKSIRNWQELRRIDPKNTAFERSLAVAQNKLGDVKLRVPGSAGALECYQGALKIVQELERLDPSDVQIHRDLSIGYEKLGDFHMVTGDPKKGQEPYEKAIGVTLRLVQEDKTNPMLLRDLAVSHAKLGECLLSQKAAELQTQSGAITEPQADPAKEPKADAVPSSALDTDYREAVKHFSRSLEIFSSLKQSEALAAGDERFIVLFQAKLDSLKASPPQSKAEAPIATKAH